MWTLDRLKAETAREVETIELLPDGWLHSGPALDGDAVAEILLPGGWDAVAASLNTLPPPIVIAAVDIESTCGVRARRESLREPLTFRDVERPLREWLWRAAVSGATIKVSTSADLVANSDALPPLIAEIDCALPQWLRESIEGLQLLKRAGGAVDSETDAIALMAGVWQMNDVFGRSHELSQSVEGKGQHRAGDYWHAINHRREPDYGNAKYWVRLVGRHPSYEPLAIEAHRILNESETESAGKWQRRLTGGGWDPMAFVDCCEAAAEPSATELSSVARQIQFAEMALLLARTYVDAVGSSRADSRTRRDLTGSLTQQD